MNDFSIYLGLKANEAFDLLSKLYDDVSTIENDMIVTSDFVDGRIRIWYDPKTQIVTNVTNS